MIEIEVRNKETDGDDYEAVVTEGIQEMVEITGFSEHSQPEALQRLLRALESFGMTQDLHVTFPEGWETWFVWDSGSYDEVDEDDDRLGEEGYGLRPAR